MVFVPEEREVAVQLEPLGEADVFVTDSSTGAGVANARLSISEMIIVPAASKGDARLPGEYFTIRSGPGDGSTTDKDGRARFSDLAQNTRYYVRVDAEGYVHFPTPPAAGAKLQPGAEPVTIELEPLEVRTVHWPVVAGEVPPPPTGSIILFHRQAGGYPQGQALPTAGRMEGSLLVADNVAGGAYLIAEAPDGSLAQISCEKGTDQGAETTFRRPRKVEVHVHDQSGRPVAEAQAVARNQGNNQLCEWATSDAEGLATLAGLNGGLADIYLRRFGELGMGERVGTVDLEDGDASLEAVLEQPNWSRARLILVIDGAPQLPTRFGVSGRSRVRVVSEEPATGELLLELEGAAPGDEIQVWISASGFAIASTIFRFPTDRSEPLERVALERTALLTAHVRPPREGKVSILPQRLDDQGVWSVAPEMRVFNGLTHPNGPGDTYLFPGLTRGHWRVLDEHSGVVSEEIEVATIADVEIVLDLSSIEWAAGRVELDDPAEMARVRIRVSDPHAEAIKSWRPGSEPPEGVSSQDGTFRIQVPGDREVTLVPWHPWLVPDPEQGAVVLHGGRDNLVLRLVAGDELRIPIGQINPRVHAIRVARYADETTGDILEWHYAPVADGATRFTVPKGRWTLWLDPVEGFAPLILRDILVDGLTELTPIEFGRGSSVRVHILVPAGQSTPRISVFASPLDGPDYGRGTNSNGEEVTVLRGLGLGRFKVQVNTIMGGGASAEKIVDLDGINDLEFEYDLR